MLIRKIKWYYGCLKIWYWRQYVRWNERQVELILQEMDRRGLKHD